MRRRKQSATSHPELNVLKVMMGTARMTEQFHNRIPPDVKHLICDQAGQVPKLQLMVVVASFPSLKKEYLTGDARQLPAYKVYPEVIVP